MRSRSDGVDAGAVARDGAQIDVASLIRAAQTVAGAFGPVDPALAGRVDKFVGWLNEQPPLRPDQKEDRKSVV